MNIKSVEDYFPGMDIIDSDIKEKIDAIYEDVKGKKVQDADIISSLNQDSLSYQYFYNILNDRERSVHTFS